MATIAGVGSKRGVVVLLHGLVGKTRPMPLQILDVGGIIPEFVLTFSNALAANGWEVIQPTFAEDWAVGDPSQAIQTDVTVDTGHGARYLAQTLHWWDHVIAYIAQHYGPTWPIVPFGISWGGWHALQIAANKQPSILAYGAHAPVTVLSALSPTFSTPADYSALDTSGLDAGSTILNAMTKPGILGWGTADAAVGFTTQQAIYNAALAAGAPITSNATSENHLFSTTDSATYVSWFASTVDPLAPAVH